MAAARGSMLRGAARCGAGARGARALARAENSGATDGTGYFGEKLAGSERPWERDFPGGPARTGEGDGPAPLWLPGSERPAHLDGTAPGCVPPPHPPPPFPALPRGRTRGPRPLPPPALREAGPPRLSPTPTEKKRESPRPSPPSRSFLPRCGGFREDVSVAGLGHPPPPPPPPPSPAQSDPR